MKKYCVDMSGFSKPLGDMPEDIHESLWRTLRGQIQNGSIAVTTEIHDEMLHLPGEVGDCVAAHKALMLLELNDQSWDWPQYIAHVARMQLAHEPFIAEFNNRDNTVGLNDLSIIALAKTLHLPIVSMEVSRLPSPVRRGIPDICQIENVGHMTFNDFLRAERVRV